MITHSDNPHKKKALDLFAEGFHCSQAVLAAFADECGLTQEQALRLGGCFGSGMRRGEVCGACTGALMALGMLYGQHDSSDRDSRARANRVNDKMMMRFADKCGGSYICRDILHCDISTPDGVAFAREHRLFTELCPIMVANAVEVLEAIMAEEETTK